MAKKQLNKCYKVYKLKYGLYKYEVEAICEGLMFAVSKHKDLVSLQLTEAILQGQGYVKRGDIEEKVPLKIVMEDEEKDEDF